MVSITLLFIEKHKKFLMSFPRAPIKNEDMAIIATFMDYLTKLEKVQPQKFTQRIVKHLERFW